MNVIGLLVLGALAFAGAIPFVRNLWNAIKSGGVYLRFYKYNRDQSPNFFKIAVVMNVIFASALILLGIGAIAFGLYALIYW